MRVGPTTWGDVSRIAPPRPRRTDSERGQSTLALRGPSKPLAAAQTPDQLSAQASWTRKPRHQTDMAQGRGNRSARPARPDLSPNVAGSCAATPEVVGARGSEPPTKLGWPWRPQLSRLRGERSWLQPGARPLSPTPGQPPAVCASGPVGDSGKDLGGKKGDEGLRGCTGPLILEADRPTR
jgi:hypothetical protein